MTPPGIDPGTFRLVAQRLNHYATTNLKERDHWGDSDAHGRIILRWIFRKWEGVVGTGWSWFRIGTGGGNL